MSRALSRTVLAAVCAALLAVAAPAQASRPSPVPSGTHATAHFTLHYDPAVNTLEYVQAGAADFEEAYAHLVDGPTLPNAGLHAPRSGADGRIDVYLTAPPEYPTFTGGMVMQDGAPGWEPYVFMTPGLSRGNFRFRAGHEMAHVIQTWYIDTTTGAWHIKGFLIEGSGDWAADFALPDIDPLDNNIATPWYSLDCYSDACGQGYWQWLFLRHEQERWGDDFMQILYDWAHAHPASSALQSLIDVEANIGPIGNTLSDRYAAFARDIWDPSRWTTGSVARIRSTFTAAEASVTRATPDTGTVTQNIDHLGTRYVHARNWADTLPSGPGDRLHVTLTGTSWPATGWKLVTRSRGATSWVDVAEPVTAAGGTFDVPYDPAVTREVLLPLSNTSTTADGRAFGYRVQLVRGTPTPPANDTPAGAQAVALDEAAATDAVYAGGEGSAEASGCPLAGGATNGVWFRFTPPNRGMYRFDATASDGPVVVSLVRTADGTFGGCASDGDFSGTQVLGRTVDVYVGRKSTSTFDGSTARLTVTGPGAPAPTPTTPATTPTTPTTTPATVTPPTPTPTVVTASVVPGLLRFDGRTGLLKVRIRCAASSPNCRLLVQVRSAKRVRVGRRRPAYVVLASKQVSIPAGATLTLPLTLPARMRALVPRGRRMPVLVRLFSGSRLVKQATATLVRR